MKILAGAIIVAGLIIYGWNLLHGRNLAKPPKFDLSVYNNNSWLSDDLSKIADADQKEKQ